MEMAIPGGDFCYKLTSGNSARRLGRGHPAVFTEVPDSEWGNNPGDHRSSVKV